MIYDTWTIIFYLDKIVGYTTTYQEADDICCKNANYTWEFARDIYNDKKERDLVFATLKQFSVTYHCNGKS